ncbi:MAG: efflux RND transporter periplasmic adaptor subunit [Dehalococcoidia bacterium]|nr:efflux RND transporter periplasmic adaptor subunit [Dehalococcoidia bacterium]
MRSLMALSGGVVTAAMILSACSGSDAASATPTETISAVARGNISQSVVSTGSLAYSTTQTLRFSAGGTVTKVGAKVGDRVTKGQVLATIDETDLAAAVARAQGSLLAAQQAYDDTKANGGALALAKAQEAIATATAGLKGAQDAVDLAKTPYAAQDLRKQEEAVAAATSALKVAQDAAALPYAALDIVKQREAVATATAGLKSAQDALTLALVPSDQLSALKTALDRAKESLANSQSSTVVTTATQQRQVTDAQTTLTNRLDAYRIVLANKYGLGVGGNDLYLTPVEVIVKYHHQVMLNNVDPTTAYNAVIQARDDMTALQANHASALTNARRSVTQAQDAQTAAQLAWDTALAGGDPNDVLVKTAKVATAKEVLAASQTLLATMLAGGDANEIALRKAKVATAEATLVAAKDVLAKMAAQGDASDIALKQAKVATSQATLAQAQEDLAKLKAGPDGVALSQKSLSLSEAQLALKKSQDNLAGAKLTAPFDGDVSSLPVLVGDTVTASTAAVVVIDPTALQVNAVVDEIDVLRVREGLQVRLTSDSLPGQTVRGAVASVSPVGQTSQGIVSFSIIISVTAPPQAARLLRGGLTMLATIVIQEKNDVLVVPARALSRRQGGAIVKVVEADGTRSDRTVTIGMSDGARVEVTGGLAEGDKVVVPARAAGGTQQQFQFGAGGIGGLGGAGGAGGTFGTGGGGAPAGGRGGAGGGGR